MKTMTCSLIAAALLLPAATSRPAAAEDVVRLGNLKFAHYGAVWYMQEIGPKYAQAFLISVSAIPQATSLSMFMLPLNGSSLVISRITRGHPLGPISPG